jgi:hypothetical protein
MFAIVCRGDKKDSSWIQFSDGSDALQQARDGLASNSPIPRLGQDLKQRLPVRVVCGVRADPNVFGCARECGLKVDPPSSKPDRVGHSRRGQDVYAKG